LSASSANGLERGARVLVRTCAAVRPGEEVVIVADRERAAIAEALRAETATCGARATVVVPPPRSIDNEEPAAAAAAAMRTANVIFLPVNHALAHTDAVRQAIGAGARVLSMTAFTPRMMREGGLFTDFAARQPLCRRLADLMTRASRVHVTTRAGTDLTLGIAGRSGNSHACLLDRAGFTAVPNIEANISPVEGTSTGLFVADGSIPYYGVGVLREPVHFTIRGGSVREIAGGDHAVFLRDLLARQNDEAVYNVAQFAMGLNPACTDFTGEMLNDEGVNGTVHIGVGTSANLGGAVRAKTHFDAICRAPSVWIDDVQVIGEGSVLIEADR
jgi:leucyl aminopeptidase (aminopeptidase T)